MSQFIEIHFPERLSVDRDDVEDAISLALGSFGDVTGAGSGVSGSNLDVEVHDIPTDEALQRLKFALRPFDLKSARARVNGGAWQSLSEP